MDICERHNMIKSSNGKCPMCEGERQQAKQYRTEDVLNRSFNLMKWLDPNSSPCNELIDQLQKRVGMLEARENIRYPDGIALQSTQHPGIPSYEELEQELANQGESLHNIGVALEEAREAIESKEITIGNLITTRDRARKERDALQIEVDQLKEQRILLGNQIQADADRIYVHLKEIERLQSELAKTSDELRDARAGRWPEVVEELNSGLEQVKHLREQIKAMQFGADCK